MLCETIDIEPESTRLLNSPFTPLLRPALLLEQVVNIARQAGDNILSYYDNAFETWQKSDDSPVTSADLAAHRIIVDSLTELTPDIPILSEESQHCSFQERSQWQRYWLIDPLDGTREFIKHNDQFTVNIALIENHRPVLGVIYAPVQGVTYSAAKECGTFKQYYGQAAQQVFARVCPPACLVVVGNRSLKNQRVQQFMQKLSTNADLLSLGSSLKSCLVAEGSVDVYPCMGETAEWDTAAAQCILEQAGGFMTDVNLRPLRYNTKPSLINPPFIAFGDASKHWEQYLVA